MTASARCYRRHRNERRAYAARHYQEHKKERQAYRTQYYREHKNEIRAYAARHYQEHKVYRARYYKKHRNENRAYRIRYRQEHPVRISLQSHHRWIFVQKVSCYVDMPFYNAWNPIRGGSFKVGEQEILAEIGPKPADGKYDLHVIVKSIGIVPGNLMWMPRERHVREELVMKQAEEIKRLRASLQEKGNGLLICQQQGNTVAKTQLLSRV